MLKKLRDKLNNIDDFEMSRVLLIVSGLCFLVNDTTVGGLFLFLYAIFLCKK